MYHSLCFYWCSYWISWLDIIGCNPTWAVVLLCFAIAIEGTGYSGYMVNQLELSPNYAGTLKGTSSTFANICGFVSPALTGSLTNGKVIPILFLNSNCTYTNPVLSLANNRCLEQCILHLCWFLHLRSSDFCHLWQNFSPTLEYILGKEGGKENGNWRRNSTIIAIIQKMLGLIHFKSFHSFT